VSFHVEENQVINHTITDQSRRNICLPTHPTDIDTKQNLHIEIAKQLFIKKKEKYWWNALWRRRRRKKN